MVCLNHLGWFTKVKPRTRYLHVLSWVRRTTFRVGKDAVKVEVVTWAILDTLSTIKNEHSLLNWTRWKAIWWEIDNEMTASILAIYYLLRGVWGCCCSGFQKSERAFNDFQISGIGCLIMIQLRPLTRNKILLKLKMAQTDWWTKKTSISYGLNHAAQQMRHQTFNLIGTPRRGWWNDDTPP